IADSSGNLYGTTFQGGVVGGCTDGLGCGTVFRLSPGGTETVLHAFTFSSEGYGPNGPLIADSSGNLYGTTYSDGASGNGVVFKLTPGGTYTVLHTFTGGSDGANPAGDLIADSSGNLYGTTRGGGASGSGCGGFGCGTVFKLSPGGTLTVLYSFTGGSDGEGPVGNLIADSKGNLYGTTLLGGGPGCGQFGLGCGVVFKLSPSGTETVLHIFTGGSDGGAPFAGLIADSSGNLYGTTFQGGALTACNGVGCGVVFKLAGAGFVPPPVCGSKDAALVNVKFPTPGTVTFDVSSPTRTLQSITLASSSNVSSSTLPAVQPGGHSATGGVFTKTDSTKSATFELMASFLSPAFACSIDPLTTTLKINTGHKVV
ncbi:MAG: choice-of-anchor tandem repeat GloVer-containing protein, partial [Acidimicrobiales bacterium]